MLAKDRCVWTPGWTETNSHSYWLKEAQVQAYLDELGPGYWGNIEALLTRPLVNNAYRFTLGTLDTTYITQFDGGRHTNK